MLSAVRTASQIASAAKSASSVRPPSLLVYNLMILHYRLILRYGRRLRMDKHPMAVNAPRFKILMTAPFSPGLGSVTPFSDSPELWSEIKKKAQGVVFGVGG